MTDTQLLRPTPQQLAYQRFEADLKANKAGVLSPRQRWRYVGVRAAEHAIGALTILLVVAVAINALQLAPDLTVIGAITLVIGLGALLLFVINVRPAFEAKVKTATGILSRSVIAPPVIQPFYCITVGNTLFYAQANRFDGLEDDELYEAYYLERPARLGGNVLLTLREVGTADDASLADNLEIESASKTADKSAGNESR